MHSLSYPNKFRRIPLANADFVSAQKRAKSLEEIVDDHIASLVIPALDHLKSVRPDESIIYKKTFKMFLDEKIPKRIHGEANWLFKDYIPKLTSEIAKRIFDLVDENFTSASHYVRIFQEKFRFVYSSFVLIDNEASELTFEEGNAIHLQVVFNVEQRLLHRCKIQRTIEAYVVDFLRPFRNGWITSDNQIAASRPKLLLGLEKTLMTHFGKLPFKAEYIQALAFHSYLIECSEYILDQFEKETGVIPLFSECKESYRYKLIFRGCLEAVLDAIDIDFPDVAISSRKVSDYLHAYLKSCPRMRLPY